MSGAWSGKAWHYRMKGTPLLDAARAWLMPILAGTAVTKYLGMRSHRALVMWVLIAVTAEGLAILIGWWAHRSGMTEADYAAAVEKDPYRRDSLRLLEEIRDLLREDRVRDA